jgi:predicted dehydrogenase
MYLFVIRVRYHYDDRPSAERNWNFPLSKDESAKHEVDDIPPFTRQLKHFIRAIRKEIAPNCSVEDGVKAVLVVEALFKSFEANTPIIVERL